MSKLHQISVSLTQGQKEKLARAYRNKSLKTQCFKWY